MKIPAPKIKIRHDELFKDSRYKPRVVKNKKKYTRKGRNS